MLRLTHIPYSLCVQMQMDEPYQVAIAAECDPWSSCGGKAPVLLELLSCLEVTVLLHIPVPYRRQCFAPATEQKAVLRCVRVQYRVCAAATSHRECNPEPSVTKPVDCDIAQDPDYTQ